MQTQTLLHILQELRELRQLLQAQLSKPETQSPELLLPEELCQRLKISRSTLHNYRQQGLPHYRTGNRTYYRWDEVLQYLRC